MESFRMVTSTATVNIATRRSIAKSKLGWVMLVIFVAAVLFEVKARAGDDVFVVPRIMVYGEGNSAIEAKQIAEQRGRRQAMDLLLRRIVDEEDWVFLPELASGTGHSPQAGLVDGLSAEDGSDNLGDTRPAGSIDPDTGFPIAEANQPRVDPTELASRYAYYGKKPVTIDNDRLRALEESFEVNEEKSSPTTYRAFITYRFKPDEVRNLLISSSIPYSEAQMRPALVIPVLETGNGLYLWERNNPWLQAWQKRVLKHELTPVSAPLGDLEDTAALSAKSALQFDQEGFAKLAARYGVSQIVVAHGKLEQSDGRYQFSTRLLNAYRESGSIGEDARTYPQTQALGELTIGATDYLNQSRGGEQTIGQNSPGLRDVIAEAPGELLSESFVSESVGNFPALADRAITETIKKYAAGWRAQTLIDHSVSSILQASAFFNSLSEWKRIRAALISTPLVGSVQIGNLSREGAQMSIQTFGDPGKLVVAMEAQGISLWTYDQTSPEYATWNIATPETAATVPAHLQQRRDWDRRSRRQRNAYGDTGVYRGVNESNGIGNSQPFAPFSERVPAPGQDNGQTGTLTNSGVPRFEEDPDTEDKVGNQRP